MNREKFIAWKTAEAMKELHINQIVHIQANNDWHGLYGIVHSRTNDTVYIQCVGKPYWQYEVRQNNMNDVVLCDIFY